MKICLINKSYLAKIWDGISTYTHFLAHGLSDSGHEVHIITMARDPNKPQKDNQSQIFIHQTKPLKILFLEKLAELIYGLKVYFKFREIDKKYGIDIIEAPEAGAEGFWLAIFARKKLITRLHTPMFFCFKLNCLNITLSRKILGWMEKFQIKHSILVSSPTRSLAQVVFKLWQIDKEKIEIIPNPINLKSIKNYQKTQDKNYLLYLGKIEKLKGIDIFLKSLKIVFRKYPDIRIYLAGGIDQTYDQSKLKKTPLKVRKNLVFLGELDRKQIFHYIHQAKLVILPSLWENLPYTLLESLVLGKIVIASNCGGFREVIKDGENGFLAKSGSHQDLALKIIQSLKLSDKKIKSIQKNAQKTSSRYATRKIVPKMLSFYSKIKV